MNFPRSDSNQYNDADRAVTEDHPADSLLRLYLDERVGAEASDVLRRHLDDCASCQRRITSLAAEPECWQAVPSSLGADSIAPDGLNEIEDSLGVSAGSAWYVESDQIRRLLTPTDDPNKIGRLGGYEVVGIVGAGATAIVLKALDVSLNRFVAIKMLRPTLAASPIARTRFAREARAAASIVHENVIEIYGVSEVDGLPYLVMPYIRGESLAKRIEQSWPLSTEAILNVTCQIADGLSAAHEKGLVHRDVKPSNVMLGDGVDRLKLTDFGLARAVDDVGLTRSGTLAGTPEYMSPEQASGQVIDHRSDLFSLGSVMYAMCTGQSPFRSESCYGILRGIVEDHPARVQSINPDVPAWLSEFVAHLMTKDPQERLSDATQVARDLRNCLSHLHDPIKPLPNWLRGNTNEQPDSARFPSLVQKRMFLAFMLFVAILVASCWNARRWRYQELETAIANPAPERTMPLKSSADREIPWDDGVDEILSDVEINLQNLSGQ